MSILANSTNMMAMENHLQNIQLKKLEIWLVGKMPAGASPTKLECIIQTEPLLDVSLMIVHVNQHYGSLDCCTDPIKKLIQNKIAKNIYEHSAWNDSFLQRTIGLKWNPGKKYMYFEFDGINYHIIDNETDAGNYHVETLKGR